MSCVPQDHAQVLPPDLWGSSFSSGVLSHIVRMPAGFLPKPLQMRTSCVWCVEHFAGVSFAECLGKLLQPLCVDVIAILKQEG